ncbi:hypothetical protein [Haloferax sp. YSMS24]|uniref:hypothetical protein n=1 Tax=unclassified Haloferax TaxID=2625095 RepID=UPI00398CD343
MTVGADGDPGDPHRTPERLRDRLGPEDDSPHGGAIDGTAIMIAAAKASVPAALVPVLLDRAQTYLDAHAVEYDREFECIYEDEDVAVYFVPLGHWDTKGAELGFSHREIDAVRRAHTEHLRRLGTDAERRNEFETALEIREVAVVDVA